MSETLDPVGQSGLALMMDFDSGKVLGQAQHGLSIDRAFEQVIWAPASTVKPLLAWQALHSGKWSAKKQIECHGSEPDASGNFCFSQHNSIDLSMAIATSCNTYFFALLNAIGRDGAIQCFNRVGYDARHLPPKNWQGTAIGHGSLLISPLQLAHAYRKLAIALNADSRLTSIKVGLEKAVSDPKGTAKPAASALVKIMGKTGSHRSNGPHNSTDTRWFVGIAPVTEPKIIVVTLTQSEESTPASTIPLATKIFDAWVPQKKR